jgi:hypothetical protein
MQVSLRRRKLCNAVHWLWRLQVAGNWLRLYATHALMLVTDECKLSVAMYVDNSANWPRH